MNFKFQFQKILILFIGVLALQLHATMLFAQQSTNTTLYYWSDLGKTPLEVSPESYILIAKSKGVFDAKLQENKNNQKIKAISNTGFFIYKVEDNAMTKTDILNDLSFEESNWELYPGLNAGNTSLIYPTKKVLFKLGEGKSITMLNDILSNYDVKSLSETRANVYSIEVASVTSAMTLANEIYESGYVRYSQPNFHISIDYHNDPFFPEQFQMHNTGQTVSNITGVNDIDCDALEAWDITTGNSSIRVAVFDQGLEAHPDLENANGVSKIVGGFSPDVPGGNGAPVNAADSHGVACAGIINASHNDIGIRGVAPDVSLLSVNIFTAQTIESLASSYTWAKDNGADVISNSWGFTDSDCSTDHPALNDAIEDAFLNGRNGKGCLIVFSSGNTGSNGCVAYPARLNTVTAVGAITSSGNVPFYSQTGPTLDLVAPSASGFINAHVYALDRVGNLGSTPGDYNPNFGGTSAAAPVVAGAAALAYSVNPDLTVSQMRTILYSSADDMGPSGLDDNFGHGRVNAHQAVIAAGGNSTPSNGVNIALNKPATQSSTQFNGAPSRAVDGNTNGVYSQGSTTHTTNEQGWWRVDLQDEYDISAINVYNRADCCADRLNGTSLYVGNINSTNPNDYTFIGNLGSATLNDFANLTVSGRYVLIDRNNSQFLSLAEVEVFGTLAASDVNVALNKPATQSSTQFNGAPSRAVDGNTNGVYSQGSTTHTTNEQGWWRVDLQDEYDISAINVYNRTDCCADRLNGTSLYVGNINSTNPNDYTFIGNLGSATLNDFANLNVSGRYVLIDRNNSQFLSLAEVEVFGTLAPSDVNVALNKPATQSSTQFNGAPSRAVDGNTNGVYSQGSTTHTTNEQGWWRVDLQDEYDISAINVYNRADCCADRLNGTSLYVGNINSTNPSDYTFIGNLSSATLNDFTNLTVSGRYVLIDRNNSQFLSLAEVEVFGSINSSSNTNFDINENFQTQTDFNEVKIFPNPANNFLNIDLSKYQGVNVNYRLIDFQGRVLAKNDLNTMDSNQESIDISKFATGNYFIYIEPSGHKAIIKRVIIMRN